MFPSFPKQVRHFEVVSQPGWAKNFRAKFLALKCLGLAGCHKATKYMSTPLYHFARHRLRFSTPCRKAKTGQLEKHWEVTVPATSGAFTPCL